MSNFIDKFRTTRWKLIRLFKRFNNLFKSLQTTVFVSQLSLHLWQTHLAMEGLGWAMISPLTQALNCSHVCVRTPSHHHFLICLVIRDPWWLAFWIRTMENAKGKRERVGTQPNIHFPQWSHILRRVWMLTDVSKVMNLFSLDTCCLTPKSDFPCPEFNGDFGKVSDFPAVCQYFKLMFELYFNFREFRRQHLGRSTIGR